MITLATLVCLICCVVKSIPLQDRVPTTTVVPTTVSPGCYYNHKYYPPGSVIENGYDPGANWCYGAHCDMNGIVQHWDDFNCVTTPTTTPEPTTVSGCVYNGKYYPFGSTIEKGYDPGSNWCYSTFCDVTGHILHGDNFNCVTTTVPVPTTTPAGPTTVPPPTTTPAGPTTVPPPTTTMAGPIVG